MQSDSTRRPSIRVNLLIATCVRCGDVKQFTSEFFVIGRAGLVRRCRACDRARAAVYRAEHVEQHREYDRARWREKKATDSEWVERRYARHREYHETHRDELNEAQRRWRADNVELHRERARRWAAANPERCKANMKAWSSANHERVSAHNRARKARARNAEGTHTGADVKAQYERQRGRCFWCKARITEYHVDHVTPLALGGSNGPENLVIACPACNMKKHATHPMDFAGVLL